MLLKWVLVIVISLFVGMGNSSKREAGVIKVSGPDTIRPAAVLVDYVINLIHPDAPDSPLMRVPAKIWYMDSMAIEESPTYHTISDSKGTISRIDINSYRFVDLRKRSIYVYHHFSDTAAIVDKFSFDAPSYKTPGGWQFNSRKETDYIGKPEHIKDTLIKGITYSRLKLQRKRKGLVFFSTLFFRCDKPLAPFTFYTEFAAQMGCPAVSIYSEYPNHKWISTLHEIHFLRNEFTENEMEVFNAWMRNARSNPVQTKSKAKKTKAAD